MTSCSEGLSPACLIEQMSPETLAIAAAGASYLQESHAFLRRLTTELRRHPRNGLAPWVEQAAAALLTQADEMQALMKRQTH